MLVFVLLIGSKSCPHKSAAHFSAQDGKVEESGAVTATASQALPDTASGALPEATSGAASEAAPESALNGVITVAPEDVCRCESISIKNHRKGQEKRASYSIEMKAQVILEAYKSGMTQEKVSSSVWQW